MKVTVGDHIRAEGTHIRPVDGVVTLIGNGVFNPWFQVKTKDGEYRIVDLDVMRITESDPKTED